MDSAYFTFVSAYDGPVHFNVKFCSAFVTDLCGLAGAYPRAATPSRVPPPRRLWGAELGRALSPSLAAATNSGGAIYGVTKRGTALGWVHRVIEMDRMKASLG
jgi:hypothetical protein